MRLYSPGKTGFIAWIIQKTKLNQSDRRYLSIFLSGCKRSELSCNFFSKVISVENKRDQRKTSHVFCKENVKKLTSITFFQNPDSKRKCFLFPFWETCTWNYDKSGIKTPALGPALTSSKHFKTTVAQCSKMEKSAISNEDTNLHCLPTKGSFINQRRGVEIFP